MKITVIYIDVLVILNIAVDYFLLKLTAFILKNQTKTVRILLSSVLGGIASLVILIDELTLPLELLINILSALIICIIAFGYKSIKHTLRNGIVFLGITYLYGGIMLGIKLTLKPSGLAVNNSVVYINISPIILIISSAFYYVAVMILKFFLEKNGKYAKKCTVKAIIDGKEIILDGLIDTGNSVKSPFFDEEIIIVDKSFVLNKIPKYSQSRYRLIPVKTVSGTAILEGYRFDTALIHYDKTVKKLIKPVLIFSETPFDNGDYNAIINPRSIL